MEFKEFFNGWIDKNYGKQIASISQLCARFDIDPETWFVGYMKQNKEDYAGTGVFDNMEENFLWHLHKQFEAMIMANLPDLKKYAKAVTEDRFYIFEKFEMDFNFKSDKMTFNGLEEIIHFISLIPIEKRTELEKNNLYSYITTKIKIAQVKYNTKKFDL